MSLDDAENLFENALARGMMELPSQLRCPRHLDAEVHAETAAGGAGELRCRRGCLFPVLRGIPRFVHSSAYASAFGRQWNLFARTQLDSYTGTTISRDRLERCLGGSLEVVAGRSILEAGCGAGRFTEILLDAGASVFALDISDAVEASYSNFGDREGYFVCQADIRELPASPASFDVVICLGVVQHTPSPEATIEALAHAVAPGGLLVLDHYTQGYPLPRSRRVARSFLLRLRPDTASKAAVALARGMLPLHRAMWGTGPLQRRLRPRLQRVSPLVDYYDAYPQLPRTILSEWALLDTHDTLTDRYKHLRSKEEIQALLQRMGLEDIEVEYGGNGVEARARKPSKVREPLTT